MTYVDTGYLIGADPSSASLPVGFILPMVAVTTLGIVVFAFLFHLMAGVID